MKNVEIYSSTEYEAAPLCAIMVDRILRVFWKGILKQVRSFCNYNNAPEKKTEKTKNTLLKRTLFLFFFKTNELG